MVMRVVIDARISRGTWHAGVGVMTSEIVRRALAARPDMEAILLTHPQSRPPFVAGERLHVVTLGVPVGMPYQHIAVRRVLSQLRADVVVQTHPLSATIQNVCPSVAWVLDLNPLLVPWRGSVVVKLYERWALPWILRGATRVVTISEASRRDIARLMGLQVSQIAVMPLGVSSKFTPAAGGQSDAPTLARYGVRGPYIFNHGNKRVHKNIASLVRAFAKLCEDPAWRHQLVIGGIENPNEAEFDSRPVRAEVAVLGLRDRVCFTGFIEPLDLPALYRNAAVTVLPSLYEGFGLSALEAMASGCPVVASNRAGLAEVVADAGVQVPPDDPDAIASAVRLIVRDTELTNRLRMAGLARAAQFTWDLTTVKFLDIIDSALVEFNRPG